MKVQWEPGQESKNLRDDAEFNLVASRRAQAAVIKAIKEGKTNVDLNAPTTPDNTPGGSTPGGSNTGQTGSEGQGSESSGPCHVHAPITNTMSASTRLLVMSSCLFKASMYGRYIFSNFLWLEMNKYNHVATKL